MKLALPQKIAVALIGILLLAVISSAVALLSAWQTEQAFRQMLARNLEQARAGYELEIALLEQGLSTSLYLMGGDPEWLSELRRSRPEFEAWLGKAKEIGLEVNEQEFTDRIARAFAGYDAKSKQVLTLYTGDRPEQAKYLWLEQALEYYDRVYQLCESLSSATARDMELAIAARNAQVKRVNLWVVISLSILVTLVAGLSVSLSRGVFRPLRDLAASVGPNAQRPAGPEERTPAHSASPAREIRSLGLYIDTLRDEVADMRSRLSQNQRRLLDAEKLASVGKLAASLAHEIRSPLTSMRLRVFSMQRALGDSYRQRDFQLISEEITRLDGIVRNFLEFARPYKPALQDCNIRLLLDGTLELMAYKLEATGVAVERQYDETLPDVLADPQQLKQVLVNLLNNALEALSGGGTIHIAARLEERGGARVVRVLVHDNGPGIPRNVQTSIFDPFFGTKEEGIGLGLWIAKRIMNEHGGDIDLDESTASGTTFSIWLPATEEDGHEQDTGS